MRRLSDPLALALTLGCSLGLAGCVAAPHQDRPQAVQGQPDTYRFRVYPYAVVLNEMLADRAAEEDIGKYRQAHGYASSRVLSREPLDPGYVYTVRFTR